MVVDGKDGGWKWECWVVSRWRHYEERWGDRSWFSAVHPGIRNIGRCGLVHNIAPGNSSAFPGSRGWLTQSLTGDPPRVTEGVVDREEVLGDLDEHWKVSGSSSVRGTVQFSERRLERLILDTMAKHLTHG